MIIIIIIITGEYSGISSRASLCQSSSSKHDDDDTAPYKLSFYCNY